MRSVRMLAMLVLAAVFSMHGLQCVSADVGGTHTGTHTDMAHMRAAPAGAGGEVTVVAASVVTTVSADALTGGKVAPGAKASSHPAPVHSGAHALAVCLGILLAGLAFLAAVLLIRRTPPGGRGAGLVRARSWWDSIQLPRPPDLASLCLLRI